MQVKLACNHLRDAVYRHLTTHVAPQFGLCRVVHGKLLLLDRFRSLSVQSIAVLDYHRKLFFLNTFIVVTGITGETDSCCRKVKYNTDTEFIDSFHLVTAVSE